MARRALSPGALKSAERIVTTPIPYQYLHVLNLLLFFFVYSVGTRACPPLSMGCLAPNSTCYFGESFTYISQTSTCPFGHFDPPIPYQYLHVLNSSASCASSSCTR